MSAAAPLLDVRDLRVSFRTRDGVVRVVDDISFALGHGEVLGVVGESGSGKSLSMLALMGLIASPNVQVSGQALFDGEDLLALAPEAVRRVRGGRIAMVFQDPMTSLNPVYRIGWQISEQLRAHRELSAAAARRRAIELLALVGIPEPARRVDAYPHEFSGGMRQRVMIAMALSCDPQLLVADEPTTALDVTIQAQILELFAQIKRELGMAIVLVSHDLGVVAGLSDRVQVMYAGQIVERAPARALFADPRHPYTRALIAAMPRLRNRRRRLAAIPGAPPAPSDGRTGCAFADRCAQAAPECRRLDPALVAHGAEADHLDACLLNDIEVARELAHDR